MTFLKGTPLALFCALCNVVPAPAAAEPPAPSPKVLLQEALFAEEAERDLEKAGAGYTALLAQFDTQRAIAATALFRLAEVRAKQGKPAEATVHFQRLLAEFPKEEALAKLSRERLAALGANVPAPPPVAAVDPNAEPVTAKELEELTRIRDIVKNSPDLLDALGKDGEAPLMTAARNGWIQVVTLLLDHGAAINGKPGTWIPLHWAASAGRKRMVELLLQRGANVNAADAGGYTAIHAASVRDRVEVARVLLEHGAKPNTAVGLQEKDLIAGAEGTPLLVAVQNGSAPMVKLLLDKGADPNFLSQDGMTPLVRAAGLASTEVATLLLQAKAEVDKQARADLNKPNERGYTPLLAAASNGQVAMVKLLLEHGARVDLADEHGFTALHYATARSAAMVDLLLTAGASATALSKSGRSPLQTSVGAGNGNFHGTGETYIDLRVPSSELPKIWSALLAKGADLNQADRDGNTTLHHLSAGSAMVGDMANLGSIARLVKMGARLDLKNAQGKPPLEEWMAQQLRYAQAIKENAIAAFPDLSGKADPQMIKRKADDEGAPTLGAVFASTFPAPERKAAVTSALRYRADAAGLINMQNFDLHPRPEESREQLRWGDVVVFNETSAGSGVNNNDPRRRVRVIPPPSVIPQ